MRYGNVVSKSAAETGAPSVNGTLPTGAFAGVHRPRSTEFGHSVQRERCSTSRVSSIVRLSHARVTVRFETAALEKSRVIDVLDFVAEAEIYPRFFYVPYYIGPPTGSDRAYAVLRAALADAGKVGIGRVMLREVQHLAGIAVVEDAIVLTLMRFADELIRLSRD